MVHSIIYLQEGSLIYTSKTLPGITTAYSLTTETRFVVDEQVMTTVVFPTGFYPKGYKLQTINNRSINAVVCWLNHVIVFAILNVKI